MEELSDIGFLSLLIQGIGADISVKGDFENLAGARCNGSSRNRGTLVASSQTLDSTKRGGKDE